MLPPDEPDSSSSSIIIEISSSSSSTSLPTMTSTAAASAATAEPGMFAAVLDQLRAELAAERRKRQALEARQRQLALHLYMVVDEQIRSVKAIKQLVQGVREGKEDHLNEMLTVMKRMRTAWGRKRPKSLVGQRVTGPKMSD